MKICTIYYHTLTDEMRKEEKLEWFSENKIQNIHFEHIQPDKNNNWLELTDNDWDTMIPLVDKETKLSKNKNDEKSVFKLFSLGVVTARDEWVYDYDKDKLKKKISFLIELYNKDVEKLKNIDKSRIKDNIDYQIKWSRAVKNDLFNGKQYDFHNENLCKSLFRPFIIENLYFSKELNEMQYQLNAIFPNSFHVKNTVISFLSMASSHELYALASSKLFDAGLLKQGNGITQCLPLYRYDSGGNRIDNITDWGLEQFQARYEINSLNPVPNTLNPITKADIFHYVYAVLHNPEYRKKYEMNLKREFPRIPFYEDFWKWAAWGKQLMDLHINFETVEPFGLNVISINESIPLNPPFPKGESERSEQGDLKIKPKLKANKDTGTIELDNQTTLSGIPKEVWDYKLGNRSALEWILDQYKEKKPKDPTIAEKFNTYRFIDYKDKVIDLLKRVTTVSVETVKIVEEMRR